MGRIIKRTTAPYTHEVYYLLTLIGYLSSDSSTSYLISAFVPYYSHLLLLLNHVVIVVNHVVIVVKPWCYCC